MRPAEAGGHDVRNEARVKIGRRREEGRQGEKVIVVVEVAGVVGAVELDELGFEKDLTV